MSRDHLRFIFYWLFHLLTKTEASGLENIPAQGGCILATNHMSRIDAALIYLLANRDDLTGLVADKYQKYPLFRWIVEAVDGIWINREEADLGALREARSYLQAGGALGIAPEGTRSRDGQLLPAKTGVAYLADKAAVPVVPIAISGTEDAMRQLLRLRRPHLKVSVAKPLLFPPVDRQARDNALQKNTDEIMCQIAAMLPPQYHGAYANHPRLRQLTHPAQAGMS
ncbi:MAG: lysophospholipid acyltransferase family protein [Anaerolineales bacterium]|nr:lysophospholipid acyltransferase family protein [Anaerolineales bacterium]